MANLTDGIVQDWLDRYLQAWRTYDSDQIGDLFTEGAEYRYHPGEEPLRGREEIVASWHESRDRPDSWEAEYSPWLVAGDRAIATGWTRYSNGRAYRNVFQLTFDDGHCSSFTEWYVNFREDD